MVNLVKQKSKTIKLERNNKVIERSLEDYNANKAKYAFRGFKVVKDLIKNLVAEVKKRLKKIYNWIVGNYG